MNEEDQGLLPSPPPLRPMEPSDPSPDLFIDALNALPNAPDAETPTASSSTAPPSPPPSLRRRRLAASRSASVRDRRPKVLPAASESSSAPDKPVFSASIVTSDQVDAGRDTPRENPAVHDAESPPQSALILIAGLIIKAILFQFSLLVKFLKFPLRMLYLSFLFVTDPFGTLILAKDSVKDRFLRIFKFLMEKLSPVTVELIGGRLGVGKFVMRLACGFFWVTYVCLVLSGILVTAFLIGMVVMGRVVEEPVNITEELSFDYTKGSPDAFVPLVSYGGGHCGFECLENVGVGRRLVPPNHRLQLTISLTLPESDYNRNLGVFQIRTEFLSGKGKVILSSSQPCMLQFKSSHIRLIETFLKSGTILAGYSSESQVLRLKMKGFTEGTEPTVCIRVILEQRAQYRPGAGIPEIYAASLKLQSELPLFRRMIWNWKRTLFIWISTWLFIFQLLIALVCCRPLVVPRMRLTDGPPRRR
ncbi:Seipin family protein [Dioscorea alata]|uniref:Seipin family protein n=1 Tax=Dioscorea alata TaxID=55571 RepID=A0ACB7V6F4_DIOAL|nr:Seipin family protein [Dioscorea alata]